VLSHQGVERALQALRVTQARQAQQGLRMRGLRQGLGRASSSRRRAWR